MKIFLKFIGVCASLFCLSAVPSLAADWATVTADKALVYADSQMSSPIGYFSKGRKIRVGEKKRNKGQVLPTVYKGRVVYIRSADLRTGEDLVMVRTASERIVDREQERKRESRVGFMGSAFFASASNFQSVEENQNFDEGSEGVFLGGLGIYGQTRKHGEKSSLKMKFEYFSGTAKDDTGLSMLLLTGEYARDLIYFKRFSLEFFAGVSLAPWVQYEADSLFKVNGYGAGFGAGAQAIWRVNPSWAVHVEGKYSYLRLFGFNLPDSTDTYSIKGDFSPTLSGPSVSGILSYNF